MKTNISQKEQKRINKYKNIFYKQREYKKKKNNRTNFHNSNYNKNLYKLQVTAFKIN